MVVILLEEATMERQVFGDTDIGLVRANNQDRFAVGRVNDSMVYAVVCDGMGGNKGGNVASQMACDFAEMALKRDLSPEMSELSLRAVFSSVFSAANALVYEASRQKEHLRGMGTTMVIALIHNNMLYVGSVGDSRCYISNKDNTRQITKDHTVVQMMVDMGEITQEEALYHPKRHFITKAVGVTDSVEMDFTVESVNQDNIVLLCSDGLYCYLSPNVMYDLLTTSVKEKSVNNLIEIAKAGGGSDNITAVVMV